MCRIRPVPVVFLLFAFMPQLSVKLCVLAGEFCLGWSDSGRNGEEEGVRTLTDLSSGIAT